jgi:tripartite-type tricarboxylate transporter receptor subunit TctC
MSIPRLIVAAVAVSAIAAAAPAAAQQWPARSVKLVVPQAPGGGTDLLARVLAERLNPALGVPFVVENRPGAGGNIGTEYVTKQPADGYTVLVTTNTHVTNVSFFKKLPYEPLKDFEAVSLVATVPFVMAVNASSPLKSAKDLIELARTKPGTVTYASGGIGTPHHLAAELFRTMAGIEMTHIPYKGSAPAAAALVANEVTTSISAVNSLLPYVRAGKLRALAVAAANRTSIMPDVPTIAEAVPLPGYAIDIWYGVLVPAATPRVIVERLNGEINRAVRDPQVNKERLNPVGLDGVGTTPERFLEVMQADIPRYLRIARDANISPE